MARECKMTQRVKDMIEGFMEDFAHNMGIPEIAKKYGISPTTIYKKYLKVIAEKNGMEREELLARIHSKHNYNQSSRRRQAVDFDEVTQICTELSTQINFLTSTIEKGISL